ncbi:hypothetical protein M0804_010380 [Polistes exclamans]|nr:hypothetical protein M0804_010380 [Polistes exclamans]
MSSCPRPSTGPSSSLLSPSEPPTRVKILDQLYTVYFTTLELSSSSSSFVLTINTRVSSFISWQKQPYNHHPYEVAFMREKGVPDYQLLTVPSVGTSCQIPPLIEYLPYIKGTTSYYTMLSTLWQV